MLQSDFSPNAFNLDDFKTLNISISDPSLSVNQLPASAVHFFNFIISIFQYNTKNAKNLFFLFLFFCKIYFPIGKRWENKKTVVDEHAVSFIFLQTYFESFFSGRSTLKQILNKLCTMFNA